MNSLSLAPDSTQLWLRLNEWKWFSLVAQLFVGLIALVPYGWVLLLRPYRPETYCRALRFLVALPVNSCSTYSVGNEPSNRGNNPPVRSEERRVGKECRS